MMQAIMGDEQQTEAGELRNAEAVCNELNAALRGLGIVLPSLWVEPGGYASVDLRPLVQLGRCNLDTARKLLSALRSIPPKTEQTAHHDRSQEGNS
jgi:hypothetical protein